VDNAYNANTSLDLCARKTRKIRSAYLIVIKLGGAVITDKTQLCVVKRKTITSTARVLAKQRDYILVHGAGSFGHIPVDKYNLRGPIESRQQLLGYARTKASLLKLENELVTILAEERIPVAPVVASSCLMADRGRIVSQNFQTIASMLKLGLVPCIGGDLVQDVSLGASVVSGDQIAVNLAKAFHAHTIIFGTDVDGLFTTNPKLDRKARLIPTLHSAELKEWTQKAGPANAPDVSGGMRGKLTEILPAVRAGVKVVIINLNNPVRLRAAIAGKPVRGTRIVA
jgi:isopentenyl phosphate kinase